MRLVPLVDLLASLRTPVEADVLIVEFDDGSSCALSIAEEIRMLGSWLEIGERVRLRSHAWPPSERSDAVVSIRAIPFATFVGTTPGK